MTRQGEVFLATEGDAYTARNAVHNAQYQIGTDIVAQCIEAADIKPRTILDYGCSTGERLEALCYRHLAEGIGCDPSMAAIDAARNRKNPDILWFHRGLPLKASRPIDLIITSYVWHWIDRDSLIEAMLAVDEQLVRGGHLVINDFYSEADVPYAHTPGVMTYKRLYPEMFMATGLYQPVLHRKYPYVGVGEPCICAVLRKK